MFVFIWVIKELVELCAEFLELYDQNPWRTNMLKLATFDPILKQPHNAVDRQERLYICYKNFFSTFTKPTQICRC